VTYWNDVRCPPLAEKRRRREKSRQALDHIMISPDSASAMKTADKKV